LVKSPLNFPEGPWKSLLEKALWLMNSIESDGFTLPRWSLGGGTVLMFYYAHRKSKDIDAYYTLSMQLTQSHHDAGIRRDRENRIQAKLR